MKSYNLILSEKAEIQIEDAFIYYDLISTKIADAFLFNLDECLNSILNNPLIYKTIKNGLRQAVLKKFPFVVVYSIEKENIIFVGCVFHTSKNPKKKHK